MIYFGLPRLVAGLASMGKIEGFMLTLALNSGAYMSEIIRGAFLAVDRGQIEAAKSINLTRMQTLAFTIGILDITAVAKIQAGITFRYFEAYMSMVIMYWLIVLALEQLQKRCEDKLKSASA